MTYYRYAFVRNPPLSGLVPVQHLSGGVHWEAVKTKSGYVAYGWADYTERLSQYVLDAYGMEYMYKVEVDV